MHRMAQDNAVFVPNSDRITAIVETHGMYSITNAVNDRALAYPNPIPVRVSLSADSSEQPKITVIADTASSFANAADISAGMICQKFSPHGANNGAMALPMEAPKLSDGLRQSRLMKDL